MNLWVSFPQPCLCFSREQLDEFPLTTQRCTGTGDQPQQALTGISSSLS